MNAKSQRNTAPIASLVIASEAATLPLSQMTVAHFRDCSPVRAFRWHRGQRHFPGWYWSATDGAHVTYESRLELSRLVLADFDPAVRVIRSQPMRLRYVDSDGRTRHHVPDFALLYHDDRIRIVNVKPAKRLADPDVRSLLEGAHSVFEAQGFETEIWSAGHPVAMSTVTFLAGYRNPRNFDDADLEMAGAALHGAMTVGKAETLLREAGLLDPRPLLMHLLWTHQVRTDVTQPLQLDSQLEAS